MVISAYIDNLGKDSILNIKDARMKKKLKKFSSLKTSNEIYIKNKDINKYESYGKHKFEDCRDKNINYRKTKLKYFSKVQSHRRIKKENLIISNLFRYILILYFINPILSAYTILIETATITNLGDYYPIININYIKSPDIILLNSMPITSYLYNGNYLTIKFPSASNNIITLTWNVITFDESNSNRRLLNEMQIENTIR